MTKTEHTELSRLTLMCRDHEVIEFTWNHVKQMVTGKARPIDTAYAPIMSLDPTGTITRDRLTNWFKNRSVPDFRPDALKRLQAIGFESAASLMASGFGTSLSDQYWIRPLGSTASWKDINCFENDFDQKLGELLLPHDDSSIPTLMEKIKSDIDVLASSPDAALNGNLPKRWEIDDAGRRIMVKAGRPANRFQEPFNEVIATDLCSRILGENDYVAYSLRDDGFMKWTSTCKTMVDQFTEFVPAYAILSSAKVPSDRGLYDFYTETCCAYGLNIKTDIEKMLVIDYLMANFDRHWNNFGILMDAESRKWLRGAPIFDTGEALWCDLDMTRPFVGYVTPRARMMRPFARNIDSQVENYCTDMSRFDPSALKGFSEAACETLRADPFVANEPGRLDKIRASIDRRVSLLVKHASNLNRQRAFSLSASATVNDGKQNEG